METMTPEQTRFLRAMQERWEELFDILCRLIRVDTQNWGTTGREKNLIPLLCELVSEAGAMAEVYSPEDVPGIRDNPDYWPGHHLEERPNLAVVIPGSDRSRRQMLAAHIDTMPVGDLANWTVDPFGGIIRDGKIWGRGACDDKYALATILYILRILHDEKIVLPYDLVFAAYCDEENGGGNGTLASCLKYPCDDILNLDCKNFEIWQGASGGGVLDVRIRAKEKLSTAQPMLPGLNVIVACFEKFRANRYAELKAQPLYADTYIPDTCLRYTELRAGDAGMDMDRAHAAFTYYTTKTKEEVWAELDALKDEMNEKLAPLGLEFDRYEMLTRFFHFGISEDSPAMDALRRAGKKVSGRTITPCGSCLSDLSLFLKYGSPRAFNFGIGRDFNAYGGAHQPDEYIECDTLAEFAETVGLYLLERAAETKGKE